MSKNVSDQLVETLVEAGIKRIYAVTGDNLNHVNAAVHRNGKIKWIHVLHEETAAYATEAHKEIIQLAGKLKAPVAYSYKGKMAIQYDNPYEVGLTGLQGIPSAYHSMHECELLVLLVTDFPYTPFMPVKNKIVQIDIKPESLGRRAKLDLGLCGDVKDTLQALIPLVEMKEDDTFLTQQLKFYQEVKKKLLFYVHDSGKPNAIHPEFVASVINVLAAKDAIFTVDTGMCCVWAARYIHGTGERKMLGSFNHGSMANAIPQSIGAALACPGKQVIAFCGEGGLSMMLDDLITIVQYKLPVKIIVFNNRSLGMVKLEMEVAGIPDQETDMLNPDFAKIAEAMGMPGITIHDPSEVKPELEKAFHQEGPILVAIQTDPNALAMPPKLEFDQMRGFALYMGKMMLSGRMDEAFKIISSNYKHLGEVI
jgi:pyruvate dehydrogenase (quinone)